ncbi:MAG: hypothetical protein H0V76_10530, partial [Blastocatellia bacterium]|nr:hypothetical protein [Blastocatellia bacterium]
MKTGMFRFVVSLLFCVCFAAAAFAQNATPSPSPAMPPGMKGADVNDPRAKLSPGLYDAGEAAMGLRHLLLLKKPEAFQLGTNDPNAPRVLSTLESLGIPDATKVPEASRMPTAQLAFGNSDLAFQGNHLFMGNFYGINIYDIS